MNKTNTQVCCNDTTKMCIDDPSMGALFSGCTTSYKMWYSEGKPSGYRMASGTTVSSLQTLEPVYVDTQKNHGFGF